MAAHPNPKTIAIVQPIISSMVGESPSQQTRMARRISMAGETCDQNQLLFSCFVCEKDHAAFELDEVPKKQICMVACAYCVRARLLSKSTLCTCFRGRKFQYAILLENMCSCNIFGTYLNPPSCIFFLSSIRLPSRDPSLNHTSVAQSSNKAIPAHTSYHLMASSASSTFWIFLDALAACAPSWQPIVTEYRPSIQRPRIAIPNG